jgi:hypothetical protein
VEEENIILRQVQTKLAWTLSAGENETSLGIYVSRVCRVAGEREKDWKDGEGEVFRRKKPKTLAYDD